MAQRFAGILVAAVLAAPAAAQELKARCELGNGHTDFIRALAFTPDGKYLVSGAYDRVPIVWDLTKGEPKTKLPTHKSNVDAVAISPDGKRLATGSGDGTVNVLEWDTGKRLGILNPSNGSPYSLAFDPADGGVVWFGNAHEIMVWDPVTFKKRKSIATAEGSSDAGALTPDGTLAVTYQGDVSKGIGVLRVRDTKDGTLLGKIDSRGVLYGFGIGPGNLVVASAPKKLELWDVKALKSVVTLEGEHEAPYATAFSPDGKWVAAQMRGDVCVFDVKTGKLHAKVSAAFGRDVFGTDSQTNGYALAFSKDSKTLAFVKGRLPSIQLFDIDTRQEKSLLMGAQSRTSFAALTADGKRVATAAGAEVVVWDAVTGRPVKFVGGHDGRIVALALTADDKLLLSAGGKTVKVWDAATGKELSAIVVKDEVSSAAISPDGKWVAAADVTGVVRAWDAATGKAVPALPSENTRDARTPVAFAGPSKLVTLGADARAWDLTKPDAPPEMGPNAMQAPQPLARSTDGSLLATAALGGKVRVYNRVTGKEQCAVAPPGKGAPVAAFSRDGKRLVVGTADGSVAVSDAATGERLAGWMAGGPQPALTLVAISPDGSTVLTQGVNRPALVWDVPAKK